VVIDRRLRRMLCGWLGVVLLFAQLATAAYACPRSGAGAPTTVAAAHMPGCDGQMPTSMDPVQPQLCKAHCEQGSQTVNAVSVVDLSSAPLLVAVLDWSPRSQARTLPAIGRRYPAALAGAPPPGSPPLYLALLVLRN
jgi:hypothetical protein